MTRTIESGGHTHTWTVTNGTRFYTRSAGATDRVSVHSVYYRRDDWDGKDGALDMYARRFPEMVKAFRW